MSDDRLERIENKLDKVGEDIVEMKVALTRNTDSLEYHVKRTNLLEDQVKSVSDHVIFMRKLGSATYWVVKVAAGLATVLAALKALRLF